MVCQKKICIILAFLALLFILLWKQTNNNYPQGYLEECKYKIKKIQMSRSINTELESDSDSESDDKLKSDSDNDSGYDTMHWL